jgi:hypothetical protein
LRQEGQKQVFASWMGGLSSVLIPGGKGLLSLGMGKHWRLPITNPPNLPEIRYHCASLGAAVPSDQVGTGIMNSVIGSGAP